METTHEQFTFTKDQVDAMRELLRLNDNRISSVWWQAANWFPYLSVELLIRWIEDARDNAFNFEAGTYNGQKQHVTITPI